MVELAHEQDCWYPKAAKEYERYALSWLKHCGRCEGWGGFPWYDSDTGHQDYDPCPDCLEQGKCPRCGYAVITEEEWDTGNLVNCDTCGYVEGSTPGAPLFEPCPCIEDQYYNLNEVPF